MDGVGRSTYSYGAAGYHRNHARSSSLVGVIRGVQIKHVAKLVGADLGLSPYFVLGNGSR